MRLKIGIGVIFVLLLAATFLMYRLWQEEKKESARLSDNMKSLCTGLEEYKIRDSLNVVENHVLRLNIEELKELRSADAKLIKELNLAHVEVAPIDVVHNLQELEDFQIQYINEGYEGIMIRNPEGLYLYDHRSHDLLKYKNFKEKEFLILDVTPDKDGQGVFVCDCGDDNTFGCRMRGTDEYRVELLQNKDNYIGSWVTVRYQSTTQKGIPTFGTGVNIRLCNNGTAIE
jgi:hypothetical protein